MRRLAYRLWKLQCRLNRRLPFSPAGRRTVGFTARGASRDVLSAPGAVPSPPPALCIAITTHARVEPCRVLLEGLHRSLERAGLLQQTFVVVVEDHSPHDYGPVLELLGERFAGRFAYYESARWLGKPGRWLTYQIAFDAIRALRPEHALFFEDDVAVTPSFVAEALALWRGIDDPDKAVLYLCRFDDDEPNGRWLRFRRREVPGAGVHLTQWFDLHAFLAGPRFFERLRYELFEPWPSRFRADPLRSSGVSEQFTFRLFGRGNVYQVDRSLAFHGRVPSVLNPEARSRRALDNHDQLAGP